MKAVMLSTQPKWCELIASGKKTIEVRKTKIPVGSKVYIYQTKKNWIFKLLPWLADRRGKVIGEFVCNKIEKYSWVKNKEYGFWFYPILKKDGEKTCLDYTEILSYGECNPIYFWHISDLKIYDKPKEQYKITRPPQSWCYVEELEGE